VSTGVVERVKGSIHFGDCDPHTFDFEHLEVRTVVIVAQRDTLCHLHPPVRGA